MPFIETRGIMSRAQSPRAPSLTGPFKMRTWQNETTSTPSSSHETNDLHSSWIRQLPEEIPTTTITQTVQSWY